MRRRIAQAAFISWSKRKCSSDVFDSPEALSAALKEALYIADEGLSTAAFLAIKLNKPLLIEGVPGVGKTEAAKALAQALRRSLVRLQCYEGIDANHALYEWNYSRQLLALRRHESETDLYTDEFLIERPLLQALRAPERTVLLIDEIDRSDHEFEAFLLEFLSDFQITIPERGTIKAATPPVVVLTSNRTRELHEALRRRCVYHWIPYPEPDKEAEIIMLKARAVAEKTARAVVAAVNGLRRMPLGKPPGIAEAIEWASAAAILEGGSGRWPEAFRRAIGVAVKDEDDLTYVRERLDPLLETACG
jgi:MoxR-like ATPase